MNAEKEKLQGAKKVRHVLSLRIEPLSWGQVQFYWATTQSCPRNIQTLRKLSWLINLQRQNDHSKSLFFVFLPMDESKMCFIIILFAEFIKLQQLSSPTGVLNSTRYCAIAYTTYPVQNSTVKKAAGFAIYCARCNKN